MINLDEVKVKNLIFIVILFTTVLSFSAPEPVKRMSPADARKRVSESATYEQLMKLREDPKKHNELMTKLSEIVQKNLNGVIALDAPMQTGISRLVKVNPLEVLTQITHLASVVKDPKSSPREKEAAQTNLKLIAESAHLVSGVTKDPAKAKAQAQADAAAVVKIIEISDKISSLAPSEPIRKFIESYSKEIREGNSIEQAVRVASKDKFTEKELRECR